VKPSFTIYKPKGCKKCGNTGYTGRIGIFEALSITDEISDIMLKETIGDSDIIDKAKEQGMISMRQDGILKVLDGVTTIEEVIRVTTE